MATRAPKLAAWRDAATPPDPAPIVNKSKSNLAAMKPSPRAGRLLVQRRQRPRLEFAPPQDQHHPRRRDDEHPRLDEPRQRRKPEVVGADAEIEVVDREIPHARRAAG